MNTEIEILEKLRSNPGKQVHNHDLTSNQEVLLRLIKLGCIEPCGLYSRLTQHGADYLAELERIAKS